jgi:hypothetical protein
MIFAQNIQTFLLETCQVTCSCPPRHPTLAMCSTHPACQTRQTMWRIEKSMLSNKQCQIHRKDKQTKNKQKKRAIIYSIIWYGSLKKNDIFLFILLFREVGLNAIRCRRKDRTFYDIFSSKRPFRWILPMPFRWILLKMLEGAHLNSLNTIRGLDVDALSSAATANARHRVSTEDRAATEKWERGAGVMLTEVFFLEKIQTLLFSDYLFDNLIWKP